MKAGEEPGAKCWRRDRLRYATAQVIKTKICHQPWGQRYSETTMSEKPRPASDSRCMATRRSRASARVFIGGSMGIRFRPMGEATMRCDSVMSSSRTEVEVEAEPERLSAIDGGTPQ